MYTSLLIISINPFIILGGNIMLRKSMTSILSCIIAVAIGVNLLGSIVYAAKDQKASYGPDYRIWNQGDSAYSEMRLYGCLVVAQAKMLFEANVKREIMNPDYWYAWLVNNDCLVNPPRDDQYDNYDVSMKYNGFVGPVIYSNFYNIDSRYIGNLACNDQQIWSNIRSGYFTICKVPVDNGSHYVLIDNQTSLKTGQLYIYNSYSYSMDKNIGPQLLSQYSEVLETIVYKIGNGPVSYTIDRIPEGYASDCDIRNGKLFVGGWAYDPDEPTKSIPVHVYSNNTFLGSIPTNAYRPDVNNAKGITGIHGFNAYFDIAPGSYKIDIYAINSAGGDNKNVCIGSYNVTLVSTINILKQPVDYTGMIGSQAAFSVVAQGTGLSYQWQYYAGGKWNNFGANKPTTSLTVSNTHNGMKYRCIVKDSSGNSVTSNEATISITKPLSITAQPKDYTGPAGSKAAFSITAQGTGLSYQWQYYSGGKWNNFGSNKPTVSLTVSNTHNGMKYRCIVKDSLGHSVTSNIATIHITNPTLSITTQPKNYTGSIGSRATFSVVAQGVGLTYQWQYYSGGKWNDFGSNKPTTSLTVSKSHNGMKYRCIVKDSFGKSVTSNVVTIKIV